MGIAQNRFVAKLASDYHKPDGVCVVSPSKEEVFIDKVTLPKLWGIGKSTLSLLNAKGIYTTGQIRQIDRPQLERMFGQSLADYLY